VQRRKNPVPSELSEFIRRLRLVSVANGAFKYRYGRAEDSPLASLWFMTFFDRVGVFGYTMPVEDEWRPSADRG
jgi:hypothetical protein